MTERVLTPTVVRPAAAELGEGPTWDAATSTLVWIDIEGSQLHGTSPSGDWQMTLPFKPGTVVPRAAGGYLLAAETGFYTADPVSGTVEQIASVAEHETSPWTRMNDGKCDPRGRLWAGTCILGPGDPSAHLYRLDPDGSVHVILDGVGASNGMGWSPDERTMYYIDSVRRTIDAFDFDVETGDIERRRVAVDMTDLTAIPDGMTTDIEGAIWVAVWGAGEVRRYLPDGSLDAVVRFPVSRPSSCTFGDHDLSTLYVTSAHYRLKEARRAAEPEAGHLFSVRPGVIGAASTPFGTI